MSSSGSQLKGLEAMVSMLEGGNELVKPLALPTACVWWYHQLPALCPGSCQWQQLAGVTPPPIFVACAAAATGSQFIELGTSGRVHWGGNGLNPLPPQPHSTELDRSDHYTDTTGLSPKLVPSTPMHLELISGLGPPQLGSIISSDA